MYPSFPHFCAELRRSLYERLFDNRGSASAERKYQPNGFCFAERNIPESVWFGEDHTLIIIKNNNSVGEWRGNYIIYDSRGDEAQTFNKLPDTKNYKIYRLDLNK